MRKGRVLSKQRLLCLFICLSLGFCAAVVSFSTASSPLGWA